MQLLSIYRSPGGGGIWQNQYREELASDSERSVPHGEPVPRPLGPQPRLIRPFQIDRPLSGASLNRHNGSLVFIKERHKQELFPLFLQEWYGRG